MIKVKINCLNSTNINANLYYTDPNDPKIRIHSPSTRRKYILPKLIPSPLSNEKCSTRLNNLFASDMHLE